MEYKKFIEPVLKNSKYMLFMSTICALLLLTPVAYMKDIYGPVVNSGSIEYLLVLTFVAVVALTTGSYIEFQKDKSMLKISEQINFNLTKFGLNLAINLTNQGDIKKSRYIFSRIKTGVNFLVSKEFSHILQLPMVAIYGFLIFVISARLFLLSIFFLGLVAFVTYLISHLTKQYIKQVDRQNSDSFNDFFELAKNSNYICAVGNEKVTSENFFLTHQNQKETNRQVEDYQSLGSAFTKFIMLLQSSTIIAVGAYLTLTGHENISGIAIIIASILNAKMIAPIMSIITGWKKVSSAWQAHIFIKDLCADTSFKDPNIQSGMPPPTNNLILDRIVLRAPNKAILVRDVSLAISSKKILAIIGLSGSGKSSLLKALVGLWPVSAGSVRLDSVDIYEWDKNELGSHIGYLPQNLSLLPGTIRDNISRFSFNYDEEKMREACALAAVNPSDYPDGLNTLIDEDGSCVSGGQLQRIALARAFYGTPKLIVLDEPTSALDHQLTDHIYQSLRHLRKMGSIVILVTHDKNALIHADETLVMEKGAMLLHGPTKLVLEKLLRK